MRSTDYLDYLAARAAGDSLGLGLGFGDPAGLARHAERQAAIAAAPDRATRVTRLAQAYLDLWAEAAEAESVRNWPIEADDREHGRAIGEGWSATGGEGPPAQAEGLIDGHVFYYRAEDGRWAVGIAELGEPSAVTVGWYASGTTGWRVEGQDADQPDWPPSERRAGIWPRLELAAAAFRKGGARRLEFADVHHLELERSLLAHLFERPGAQREPVWIEAWFVTPQPFLGGQTAEQALADGQYTRVNALILAEGDGDEREADEPDSADLDPAELDPGDPDTDELDCIE